MADETPPPPRPAVVQTVPRTPPVAIWSLILAVLSFTCGWLFAAIPAVICGHIARAKIRKSGGALGGRGTSDGRADFRLHRSCAWYNGIPLLISMIQSDRERLHRLSTERKEIASDDGKIKVTVPGMWTKMPGLNKFASLQVGDKRNRMYLIVVTEAKADVPKLTLQTYDQLTLDEARKHFQASASEPVSLMIDGHPALQQELSGTEKGTDVVLLHTTVDDGDHFQTINAWTIKSRWKQQNQLLREVTASFRSEK